MAYSYITLGQSKRALAQRLCDDQMQFFDGPELGAYIREALQTFNAMANFYRQEFTFNSAPNVTWYDLTDSVAMPNTLRPLTTTDKDLLQMMEYHLLEPQSSVYPMVWAGSRQFSIADLLSAIQQLRDQVLSESTCTISQALAAAIPGRTFLPDTMLNLRRVAWTPVSGFGFSVNILVPSDLWAQQSFESGFPQSAPGYPSTYRLSTEPPLAFDVDVQPAVPGNYDLLTVNAGSNLSTTQSTVLAIPNDWCHVVKWGALAQLFGRDSVASDPFRAKYCQMRYREGISAMRSAPALLAARINDEVTIPIPITAGDSYDADWQGQSPGTPTAIYYAGLNMIALARQPASNGFSMTASVVRNMVLPSLDADFIQVGRDDLAAVLDEAQHIAMLKCGGAEFAETFPLHVNFLRRCAIHNSKLSALSLYLEFLDGRAQSDERLHPSFQGVDASTVKS